MWEYTGNYWERRLTITQNWFDQVILIPQLVSTSCLLLNYFNTTSLFTNATMAGCERIPARAYDRRDAFIQGVGYLTGANTINVMQNSVSLGLYTYNQSIVEDAYARATGVVTVSLASVVLWSGPWSQLTFG